MPLLVLRGVRAAEHKTGRRGKAPSMTGAKRRAGLVLGGAVRLREFASSELRGAMQSSWRAFGGRGQSLQRFGPERSRGPAGIPRRAKGRSLGRGVRDRTARCSQRLRLRNGRLDCGFSDRLIFHERAQQGQRRVGLASLRLDFSHQFRRGAVLFDIHSMRIHGFQVVGGAFDGVCFLQRLTPPSWTQLSAFPATAPPEPSPQPVPSRPECGAARHRPAPFAAAP